MTTRILVRPGNETDLPGVLALIKELAEYERAKDEVETTCEQMKRDGFGPQPIFQFFVALAQTDTVDNSSSGITTPTTTITNETIVGTAIYFYSYSTWKGKCLYLEDLVITQSYRRQKIGKKLLHAVIQKAKEENCARVQWQVLDWNEPAIAFYKSIGASLDNTWLNCRLTRDNLDKVEINLAN